MVGVFRTPTTSGPTLPSGYLRLGQDNDAGTDEQYMFAHPCDGTEGATFDLTLGTPQIVVAATWAVRGGDPLIPWKSNVQANTSTGITTGTLPVFARPARACALIILGGAQSLPTAGWANYGDIETQYTSGGSGAAGCSVFGAVRYGLVEEEASLNNGQNATNWTCMKIAVPRLRTYGRIPRGVDGWDGLV